MCCFGLSVGLQEAGADVTTVDVCYWLKVSLCPVYIYMNKMMLKMYFKLKSCNASMGMGRKWIKIDNACRENSYNNFKWMRKCNKLIKNCADIAL